MNCKLCSFFGILVFLVTLTACATSALAAPKRMSEKVAERVSRGIIEESLDTLDQAENRARLGRILGSRELRVAMHDLAAAIVLGVFDGVKEARTSGALGDTDIAKEVSAGMDSHVTPAVGRLTYRIVDSALTASLADKHIAQMEKVSEVAVHAAVRGLAVGIEQDLGPALAVTLDKDVGPAVAQMIERDIMPAIGRGLTSADIQIAIRTTTNSIATGLVHGTDQTLTDIKETNVEEGDEGRFALFGKRMAMGYATAQFVAIAFGMVLIVLTVVLLRTSRRQRRQSEQAARRERALLNLIDSIESDHPELKLDTRQVLRDQFGED